MSGDGPAAWMGSGDPADDFSDHDSDDDVDDLLLGGNDENRAIDAEVGQKSQHRQPRLERQRSRTPSDLALHAALWFSICAFVVTSATTLDVEVPLDRVSAVGLLLEHHAATGG